MTTDDSFLIALQEEARTFTEAVATEQGDWIVKGFIDVYKRIYTVSVDTKVTSKVMELLLIPRLVLFGAANGYDVLLPRAQNQYPDLSFVSRSNPSLRYAVDIKSTYKISATRVNGMTLGAFTGYFIDRNNTSTSTFPYNSYKMHIALGVIYSQTAGISNEQKIYLVDGIKEDLPKDYEQNNGLYERVQSLEEISSVIKDFTFFVQPKYKIAHTSPGSGNTKNIGSVKEVERLIHGTGPFSSLGEAIYDDYYTYYVTLKDHREQKIPRPYKDLPTYVEYKTKGVAEINPKDLAKAITAERASNTSESDEEDARDEVDE